MNQTEISNIDEITSYNSSNTKYQLAKNPQKYLYQVLLVGFFPSLLSGFVHLFFPVSNYQPRQEAIPHAISWGAPLPTDFFGTIPFILMGIISMIVFIAAIYKKYNGKQPLYLTIDDYTRELTIQYASFDNRQVSQTISISEIESILLIADFRTNTTGAYELSSLSHLSSLTIYIQLKDGNSIKSEISSWQSFLGLYEKLYNQVPIELEQNDDVKEANLKEIIMDYMTTKLLPYYVVLTKFEYLFLIIPTTIWFISSAIWFIYQLIWISLSSGF